MDHAKLRRLYGRLKGIKELTSTQPTVDKAVGDDYNNLVQAVSEVIEEDLSSFLLTGRFFYEDLRSSSARGGELKCLSNSIRDKLLQLTSYLEYGFNLSEKVIEIGSIYNSITDEELKSRCSDILSAPGNFDRVINQATLVLEERIRKRSGLDSYSGVELVNKALNSELSKSVLQVSDDPDVHEGIAHICRGIVLAFRNPTHHRIITDITREDALKVCAFIDNLLQMVDTAKLKGT